MNIKDLTKEEILALTDDRIKTYVDYQCAVNGVRMLTRPEEPVKNYAVKMEDVAFIIPSFIIKDLAVVEQIMKIISQTQTYEEAYDYNGMGWNYKWLKEQDVPLPHSRKLFYKQEDLMRAKTLISEYTAANDKYKEALKEFDEHDKKRRALSQEIYDYIDEIHEKERQKNSLLKKFDDYKAIANGDASIAAKFLVKAYPEAAELLAGMIVLPEPELKTEEVQSD